MLEAVVGDGAGIAGFFWFRGGTVSDRLVGVGAADVAPVGADVVLGVGVGSGLRAGAGIGFGVGFGSGFGIGSDLSSLPGFSCWRSSGFSGPPDWVRCACIAASRPTSSFWSRSVAATTLATMSVMRSPHSRASWWYPSRVFSFSSNHDFIPHHCASCGAVWVSSMFAIFATVRCSCASSLACC